MVDVSKSIIGVDGENLQNNITFTFDEFVDGTARLEFVLPGKEKNYVMLTKNGESYTTPIKNIMTKQGKILMQLVITERETDDGIPVFKSKEFYLVVNESIDADIEAPDSYSEWIDIANDKLNKLDFAIEQVENLDLEVEKTDNRTTVIITKKDGSTKEVEILDGKKGDPGERGPQGPAGTGYDDTEIKADISLIKENINLLAEIKADKIDIPIKTSDLENDDEFITNDVNNLLNYYSKQYIDETIGNIEYLLSEV